MPITKAPYRSTLSCGSQRRIYNIVGAVVDNGGVGRAGRIGDLRRGAGHRRDVFVLTMSIIGGSSRDKGDGEGEEEEEGDGKSREGARHCD